MEFNVKVEKPSNTLRKLTIKVPATEVSARLNRGLAEVQRTAHIKGFRPGQAPIGMIRQMYGDDVKHKLFHSLIDESFREAVRKEQIKAVGRPQVDASNYKTGEGAHDHALRENEEFTYTATVEVMPEIEIKNYTGLSLTQEKINVTDEDLNKVVEGLRNSQAQLIPAAGGLANADGTMGSRPIKKGDFADIEFNGGVVTENGVIEKAGMKGNRLVEIGSDSLIPGFEDHLVGARQGEVKTFRVPFPADFYEKELAGAEAEFTVSIKEVKEKKLPELDDEFAKQAGYESFDDLKTKARQYVESEKAAANERKLRNDIIEGLSQKNKFDIPSALIEAQAQSLAQEWASELKKQGMDDQSIQQAMLQELEQIKTRAATQVRASLMLESIADAEKIEVSDEEFQNEMSRVAESMKVEPAKLKDFYSKNPSKKEDFVFRLRQDRTFKYLMDKAKIKTV